MVMTYNKLAVEELIRLIEENNNRIELMIRTRMHLDRDPEALMATRLIRGQLNELKKELS